MDLQGLKRPLHSVKPPHHRGAGRLDPLVEPGKVRQLSGVVGERAHEPVGVRLPHCVEEAVEEVEEAEACELGVWGRVGISVSCV